MFTTTSTPPSSSHREIASGHEVFAPGDVEPLRECGATALGDLGRDRRGPLAVDVGDQDPGTAGGQLVGDRPADATPGAGDDCVRAVEVEGSEIGHPATVPPGTRPRGRRRIPVMGRLRYTARLGSEFVSYSVVNRAWWVVPMVALLGLVALAIAVGQAAAPYTLYTLF